MSIVLTLTELKSMEQPLTKLLEEKLPAKVGFKLSKVLKDFSKELSELETQREKLIREYGELSEESNQISITSPEKLESFHKEFGDLLKEEITFDYNPISIDLLDNTQLTVAEMAVLSVLFTD